MPDISAIRLALPYRMGTVNCYLIKSGIGYVLIDTGPANRRAVLEKALGGVGCQPGMLRLIILTHGDFDHTGNAAYLRGKFGSKIAMHGADAGMAERGDMFSGRKKSHALLGKASAALFGFGKGERFAPDTLVEDGASLSGYGLDAQVLSTPGHSQGSIGILTTDGDLFCGDLLENTRQPALGSIMDDRATASASIARLTRLPIHTIYPGHGEPFARERFTPMDG